MQSQPEFGESYLDKQTGDVVFPSDVVGKDCGIDPERLESETDRFLYIDTVFPKVGWNMMDDFVQTVESSQAKAALSRALQGKRPFRSFKDQLLDFPEIRQQWFSFYDARMRKLAIQWLKENGIAIAE